MIFACILFTLLAAAEVWWLYRFLDREDRRRVTEDEVETILIQAVLFGPLNAIRPRLKAAAIEIQQIIEAKTGRQ